MELCRGGELFERIGNLKQLTEDSVCDIMRQLFSVVSYLHSRGIVHSDIKPENLLIEERGEELYLQIADFGNASIMKEGAKLSGETGTSYYMAPEVISGEYTEKCDEWSCGVIMYMLLCGQPPFQGDTDEAIIENVKKQEYSLESPELSKVSDRAKDLIKKLLVPESERITAAEALAHSWIQSTKTRKFIKKDTITSVTENLKNFRKTFLLKEAIKSFIISQIFTIKDTKLIRDVFSEIDRDNDGKISTEDLYEYFKQNKDPNVAKKEAESIMENVDYEFKGYIEYSQYLKASIDSSVILSKNNVILAFNMLDPEKTGKISAADLMCAIQEDQTTLDVWKETINEFSNKRDGMINLEEFISTLVQKI